MRRYGFTKWEALVVIAIIIILAAILLPVFVRGGHSERRLTCQSNLKLIGQAFLIYTEDYDTKYPPALNSRHGLKKPISWIGVLAPYLNEEKESRTFQCPSEELKDRGKSSYGYSAWLDARRKKDLAYPERILMNFEVVADDNNWTQTGTGTQAISAKTRHAVRGNERANYSFADGHVKSLKPDELSNGSPERNQYTFAVK